MDYIIFFDREYIEVNIFAQIRTNVTHDESKYFDIVDGKINWENVDSQMISESCQEYCNRIQKIRVFG